MVLLITPVFLIRETERGEEEVPLVSPATCFNHPPPAPAATRQAVWHLQSAQLQPSRLQEGTRFVDFPSHTHAALSHQLLRLPRTQATASNLVCLLEVCSLEVCSRSLFALFCSFAGISAIFSLPHPHKTACRPPLLMPTQTMRWFVFHAVRFVYDGTRQSFHGVAPAPPSLPSELAQASKDLRRGACHAQPASIREKRRQLHGENLLHVSICVWGELCGCWLRCGCGFWCGSG